MKLFGRKGKSIRIEVILAIVILLLVLCMGFGYCLRFVHHQAEPYEENIYGGFNVDEIKKLTDDDIEILKIVQDSHHNTMKALKDKIKKIEKQYCFGECGKQKQKKKKKYEDAYDKHYKKFDKIEKIIYIYNTPKKSYTGGFPDWFNGDYLGI